jgi:hypothetical protein
MRTKITLIAVALLTFVSSLQAQTRFIDPMFEVGEASPIVYGQNVDVFLSAVNALDADVYEPVGDESATLRPLVVVFPTGNFLIQYLNQGPYGSLKDSSAVEIINRLVSRGYVGMVAEYRTGWLPTATVQDIRTSTLLQAAYRGGQDAHTLARYLRKTVVEDGNPMRIDTNRVVFWGLGTGGYVTMTHAFLDDIQEVLDDERFYDVNDMPYVSAAVNADPQGLLPGAFANGAPSNIPNHVGYGSSVAMSINCNGALGDSDWMNGTENEPIVLGYQSPSDPFAPFSDGTVIVPTTGDVVLGGVSGTESIIEKANMLGLNDKIADANSLTLGAPFPALSTVLNNINAVYKEIDIDLSALGQGTMVDLSHDNMFPLSVGDTRTPTGVVGSSYNWIDSSAVRVGVTAFNAAFGQEINATSLIANEALANPNAYDAVGARLVMDTIMAHFIPRAFIGMELQELVSTNDLLDNNSVGLEVFPNPAGAAGFTVKTEAGHPILSVKIVDFSGRVVANYSGLNTTNYTVNRGNLVRGTYVILLQLEEGITTRKLIME